MLQNCQTSRRSLSSWDCRGSHHLFQRQSQTGSLGRSSDANWHYDFVVTACHGIHDRAWKTEAFRAIRCSYFLRHRSQLQLPHFKITSFVASDTPLHRLAALAVPDPSNGTAKSSCYSAACFRGDRPLLLLLAGSEAAGGSLEGLGLVSMEARRC